MRDTGSLKTIDRSLRFKFPHQSGIVPAKPASWMRTEQWRQTPCDLSGKSCSKALSGELCALSRGASCATVGASKSVRMRSSTPNASRIWLTSRVASSECPQAQRSYPQFLRVAPQALPQTSGTTSFHQACAARDSFHAAPALVWAMLCGQPCHWQSEAMHVS